MNAKCICHLIYLRLIWFCSLPSMILLFDIGKTSGSILQKKKVFLIFILNETHFLYYKENCFIVKESFLLFQKVAGSLTTSQGAALGGREKFNPSDETEILQAEEEGGHLHL